MYACMYVRLGIQLHDELKAAELKHQTTSGSVGDLTESLSALSDELQELKEKMDSKGDAVGAEQSYLWMVVSAFVCSPVAISFRVFVLHSRR